MPHDFEGGRRRGVNDDDGSHQDLPAIGIADRRPAGRRLRVLALTKYEDLAASSRYRFLNYMPLLEEQGIDIVTEPLLSNSYVERRQAEQRAGFSEIAQAFLHRVKIVLRSRRFDVIWVEGELFPRLPAIFERVLKRLNVPYVVDIDDAIFHAYDRHPSKVYRAFMGRKVDIVMRRASAVIAGNAYLADRARAAGASNVVLVPTAIDHTAYRSSARHTRAGARPKSDALTVGWIGSPVTAHYLRSVERGLSRFLSRHNSNLVLVGAGDFSLNVQPVDIRPWSPQRELSDIASFDIGIAPLIDGAWERGKCGLKAIQYMGMGVPVVASDCGALPSILGEPASGLLYHDDDEFFSCLDRLAESPELRVHLGENGRERVATHYSIHKWAGIVGDTLRQSA